MNKYVFRLSILLIVLGFGACKKNKHSISGQVLDYRGSGSIASIEVEGQPKSNTTSGSNGNFEIEDLPKGSCKVKFTSQNSDGSFSSRTQELTVGEDGVVVMLPNPVILRTPILGPAFAKDSVRLSWTKSIAADFREYKVYRHTSPGLDEVTGTLLYVATSADDTLFTDEIDHGDQFYYRVFVLNEYGLLGGSNIESIAGIPVQNNPLIQIGVDYQYFMNKGDIQWYDFQVVKGTAYKVTWRDSWFAPYTANSIFLGAYHSDKQNYYFYDERLIQMIGGPRAFVGRTNETAHLKVYGYNGETNGTFYTRVDTLDRTLAQQMSFNTDYSGSFFVNDTKMFCFDALKDTSYKVAYYGVYGGGAGDGLSVQLTCYSALSSTTFINRDYVPTLQYADTINIVPDASGKIYLALTSVFFGVPPTNVNLKIIK